MKKIDLGQTINTLANIGVIAGIAFLAIELQQNNEQLQAQTRNSLFELQARADRDLYTNEGGLWEIIQKVRQGEDLPAIEATRLGPYRASLMRTWEFMYLQDAEGARNASDFMVTQFRFVPGLLEGWEASRGTRDPSFEQFIDENVLSQLEP